MLCAMSLISDDMDKETSSQNSIGLRSHSAQGVGNNSSPLKIPLPPRLWITDIEDDSSDDMSSSREDGVVHVERSRMRSRFRHHKRGTSNCIPLGIFWDIENCQVPRGCSAIDVVAAIRAKFLVGRREADFVVVCDVRKELPNRLQELNDSQVNLIHVCGTQKNAADEKLRQCMRRFGELHPAPASLLLISGDINFAADLSDFRHRKNMEVILVHKQNTSAALITCASSHFCYNELTAHLPRNPKVSQTEEDEEPTCEMEVINLPVDQPPERVSRRLRRLADNCGGKVLRVTASTAMMKFPTPDHTSRALKRMEGEDVFGRKISTRYVRSALQPAYSSDEGYCTAPPSQPTMLPQPPTHFVLPQVPQVAMEREQVANEWALALKQLPVPAVPLEYCPPPKPRKIRGRHGSASLDQSACSSSNCSAEDSRLGLGRSMSPWNSSASFSDQSETEDSVTELTVANLPPHDPNVLQDMVLKLLNQHVPVLRVTVWSSGEGPVATVLLRSEGDARLAIARIHKRRLDNIWAGRRLDLSLGRPSPAPSLDVLRARLRAILLEHRGHTLPLVRLRDAYASRHSCAITTSDIAKIRDTVVIQEGFGRMVQLVDFSPASSAEMEEAPWRCNVHATFTGHDDGSRILQPVFMKISVLTENIRILLEGHNGILPLLSFVECYESMFPPLVCDPRYGVSLELLLRSIPCVAVKDSPSRHLAWAEPPVLPPPFDSCDISRVRGRTAPALEPMLALIEKELLDLLRAQPKCSIQFSKLIPAFHHHFGRQCRVADYGFTKLPDLLAALNKSIVVLGSGSYRIITISASAQSRRWTSDVLKILNSHLGQPIHVHNFAQYYQAVLSRPFSPVDYGVCTFDELLQKTLPGCITVGPDGSISLPVHPHVREPQEASRILEFAAQTVEILCHTPNFQMEFSRFVPMYHTYYGKQLRVAHFSCAKLMDLFEIISQVVTVHNGPNGERMLKLGTHIARPMFSQRLKCMTPLELATFPMRYTAQYGAPPQPAILEVKTIEDMVLDASSRIEWGYIYSTGDNAIWVNAALTACSVLSADRSVARGSSEEYFVTAYTQLKGSPPQVIQLQVLGVLEVSNRYVRLAALWRTIWRVVMILADHQHPVPAMEVFLEYTKRFGPTFPKAELGLEAVVAFLKENEAVFKPVSSAEGPTWHLGEGVFPPQMRELVKHCKVSEDYSKYDTPPGQKGSRVFESPKRFAGSIWSPPASSVPLPDGLIGQDKRRIRLAAQFDSV
ncbi:meiosis regulator and mRNA stability factor 1 isoform X1 [Pieris rapae]|uniref:meiosis regulator and mRNA stability factor 1 isoform X1 n=1 Tax=Pieris rapae TaxID=64459 RepID=UPI001E281AB1|nr:meiosis regulator and mRNA stability factor 1 isoform X1 [Pieris rapae]